MSKVSIIVPVYNVQQYLGRCIDSVLGQTFIDFELLLINDGSTDSSGVICCEYAAKDNRVRVFHKQNGGLSSARNVGITNAVGEYVIFLDSDDYWTSSTVLNKLLVCAIQTGADIVRGEICYVDEDGKFLWDNLNASRDRYANKIMQNAQFVDNIVCGKWWVCLSLYRSNILQKFEVTQKFQEDIDFHIRVFSKNLKCLYIPLVFYAYRIRTGSLINSVKQSNLYYSFRLCNTFREYSNKCQDEILSSIYQRYSIMMYYWNLYTLCEFFFPLRSQIIIAYNLKEIQRMVMLLSRGNIFKYPIPVFLPPNWGCIVLNIYIKLKKITKSFKNKIFRR